MRRTPCNPGAFACRGLVCFAWALSLLLTAIAHALLAVAGLLNLLSGPAARLPRSWSPRRPRRRSNAWQDCRRGGHPFGHDLEPSVAVAALVKLGMPQRVAASRIAEVLSEKGPLSAECLFLAAFREEGSELPQSSMATRSSDRQKPSRCSI